MQFFLELLNCNYELCYWKYDADIVLDGRQHGRMICSQENFLRM